MNVFDKFNRAFGFTPAESRVIIFLVAAFLVGLAIRAFKQASGHQEQYDYSSLDSEFVARSQALYSGSSSIGSDSGASKPADKQEGETIQGARSALALESLNINTATKDELVKLPGIGEALAERIIIYRDEFGPFKSVDELQNIKGIGKKKFEQIALYCTIGK